MGFKELIRRVRKYSGFSHSESKDALELMVESLAVHMTDTERRNFAAYLPEELADLALSVYANEYNSRQPILEQFIEMQHIEPSRAKLQITSAWRALEDVLGPRQVNRLRSQLPGNTVAMRR